MKHFKLSRESIGDSDNPLKACIVIDYCPHDGNCDYTEWCDVCPDTCYSDCFVADFCGPVESSSCYFTDCDAYYCGNVEFGPDGCVCNGDTCSGSDTCESDIS